MAKAKEDKKTAQATAPKTDKVKKEKKEPVERVKQEQANGVTHPKKGTQVGRIWEIADSLSKLHLKNPQVAARADVLAASEKEGINAATAATQYGRWRRFHGITGRVTAEAAE